MRLSRVCEVTQRCKPASAWKEAARIVELEREKEQLEDGPVDVSDDAQ